MSRSVIEEVDDTKLWQEGKHSLTASEQQDTIEHLHPYGFTSVPQKPTGSGMMRRAAEAIFSFLGGNRSQGVAISAGDRRYRLYKLDNGEVALHDDQGQQVHFKRDGIWGSVPNSKKIVMQIMDDDQLPQDTSGSGGAQAMGQIKQAGRPSSNNFTLDKNSLTVNHTTQINLTAPTIVLTGNCHLGGPGGVPASQKGTIDTNGDADITNLATKVWLT